MKRMMCFLAALVFYTSHLVAVPRVVVFDLGGVLTGKPNREGVITFICRSLHLSAEDFERVNQEKHLALQQGKTDEEFWVSYAKKKEIRLSEEWITSFRTVMKEAIGVNSKMYSLVDQLKQRQISVALLSNIDERLSKLIRDFDLYKPFDPCLLSCEIGVEKPDVKAYELLLKVLNFQLKT